MVANRMVLVIDDDPFLRSFCETILTSAGFDVTLADDAKEGVRLAETLTSQLILLDYAMPGMTGLQFLTALVDTRPRQTPVIMLSAWDSPEVRRDAERLGAVWLRKPVTAAQLLDAVNKSINALAV